MLKSLLLGFCAAVCLAACAQKSNGSTANDGKHFGAMVTANNAVAYDDVMAKMATVDHLPMKVTGDFMSFFTQRIGV